MQRGMCVLFSIVTTFALIWHISLPQRRFEADSFGTEQSPTYLP